MIEETLSADKCRNPGYQDDVHLKLFGRPLGRLTGEDTGDDYVLPPKENNMGYSWYVPTEQAVARAEFYQVQGGRCAICKTEESCLGKKLALDHDHETGAIRGLLCATCNTLLGHALDSVDILKSAIDYLIANGK